MTTATLYTINDINSLSATAAHFGGTTECFTVTATPSEESISEGCDAVDRQNLIVITPVNGLAWVYFQAGTAGWALEPQASTAQEFCEGEYSGEEWAFYSINQVERF